MTVAHCATPNQIPAAGGTRDGKAVLLVLRDDRIRYLEGTTIDIYKKESVS